MLTNNPMVQGARGKFGGVMVFRTLRGKTVISAMPKRLDVKPKDQSAAQRRTRTDFKNATLYAKNILKDPAMKDFYQRKAKKLKLPNAYTAAITDYMRRAKVESVDMKKYTGKPGGQIAITVGKNDFSIKEVNVTLQTKTGEAIENGVAVQNGHGVWTYRNTTTATPEEIGVTIEVKESTGRVVRWLHPALIAP